MLGRSKEITSNRRPRKMNRLISTQAIGVVVTPRPQGKRCIMRNQKEQAKSKPHPHRQSPASKNLITSLKYPWLSLKKWKTPTKCCIRRQSASNSLKRTTLPQNYKNSHSQIMNMKMTLMMILRCLRNPASPSLTRSLNKSRRVRRVRLKLIFNLFLPIRKLVSKSM